MDCGCAMSSNWFAKHFGCWTGHEQRDDDGHQQQKKNQKNQKQVYGVESKSSLDKMSIMRNSKRFGQQQNCAKDGVVKCCDKFCKNNCNLSMMRNDLKGNLSRRSFNSRTSKSCN